jgi:hypothetical protein
MLETAKKFCLKKPKIDNFRFAGIEIETRGEERIIHQTSYIGRLNLLPKNSTIAEFWSCRAQFAWITSTRPDISTVSSQCSSVTETTFSTDWVLILNDAMKYLRQTSEVYLRYPKLDSQTIRMVVYTDGSMANNGDLSPQVGYITVLSDASGRCCVLAFSSHKSGRIVRSSLAAETLAMSDGYDQAYTMRHDIHNMMGFDIALLILTDSKSLFDVITRRQHTTKRLVNDVVAIREGFRTRSIANIGLIRSAENSADGLTKRGFCTPLHRRLKYGHCSAEVL